MLRGIEQTRKELNYLGKSSQHWDSSCCVDPVLGRFVAVFFGPLAKTLHLVAPKANQFDSLPAIHIFHLVGSLKDSCSHACQVLLFQDIPVDF